MIGCMPVWESENTRRHIKRLDGNQTVWPGWRALAHSNAASSSFRETVAKLVTESLIA
jgi:hypothetical protein